MSKTPYVIALNMVSRKSVLKYASLCVISVLCGVFFVAAAVHWNGKYIEVLDVTLDAYDIGGQRIPSMKQLFDEMYCYGWLFPGLPAFYSIVLTPLATSFSVNGSLWLRLIVLKRVEFAIGRTILSLTFLIFITICGIAWAECIHLLRDIPFNGLIRAPIGFAGACALSSGAFMLAMNLVDARQTSSSARHGLQAGCLLLPVINWLVWMKARPPSYADVASIRWIPFAVPFISSDSVALAHSISCLLFGLIFYCISICLALQGSLNSTPQQG